MRNVQDMTKIEREELLRATIGKMNDRLRCIRAYFQAKNIDINTLIPGDNALINEYFTIKNDIRSIGNDVTNVHLTEREREGLTNERNGLEAKDLLDKAQEREQAMLEESRRQIEAATEKAQMELKAYEPGSSSTSYNPEYNGGVSTERDNNFGDATVEESNYYDRRDEREEDGPTDDPFLNATIMGRF